MLLPKTHTETLLVSSLQVSLQGSLHVICSTWRERKRERRQEGGTKLATYQIFGIWEGQGHKSETPSSDYLFSEMFHVQGGSEMTLAAGPPSHSQPSSRAHLEGG